MLTKVNDYEDRSDAEAEAAEIEFMGPAPARKEIKRAQTAINISKKPEVVKNKPSVMAYCEVPTQSRQPAGYISVD